MTFTLLLFTVGLCLQEPHENSATEADSAALQAAPLRDRIRYLRRDLIAGGDNVDLAEKEAVSFYEEKMRALDRQADELAVELAEKSAAYDLALERTLSAKDGANRSAAANDASRLKGEIARLEGEITDLQTRRQELNRAVDVVNERGRARDRLITDFDAAGARIHEPMISPGGLGLAPETSIGATDGLKDDAILKDLLQRDPERAKALIYAEDPELYWATWPLQPPTKLLRRAMRIPIGDLHGRR